MSRNCQKININLKIGFTISGDRRLLICSTTIEFVCGKQQLASESKPLSKLVKSKSNLNGIVVGRWLSIVGIRNVYDGFWNMCLTSCSANYSAHCYKLRNLPVQRKTAQITIRSNKGLLSHCLPKMMQILSCSQSSISFRYALVVLLNTRNSVPLKSKWKKTRCTMHT